MRPVARAERVQQRLHSPCFKCLLTFPSPPPLPFPPAAYPELVQAAYLVDAVDVTRFSPESEDNPSGGWRWLGGCATSVQRCWRAGRVLMREVASIAICRT